MMKIQMRHLSVESLRIGMLLAGTTGVVDGYTFQAQGGRFASLQTGNLIQTGIHLAQGEFSALPDFLIPVLFFALGAGVATAIQSHKEERWRRRNVLIQLFGLLAIAVIGPVFGQTLFVAILSFFMAFQANAFTKVHGMPYATIMSTGNVRSLGVNLAQAVVKRDGDFLKKSRVPYIAVIASFIIGATLAGVFERMIGCWALLLAPFLLLFVVFSLDEEFASIK